MRAHHIPGHPRHRMRRPYKAPARHCRGCGRFVGPSYPIAAFRLCIECLPAAAQLELLRDRLSA